MALPIRKRGNKFRTAWPNAQEVFFIFLTHIAKAPADIFSGQRLREAKKQADEATQPSGSQLRALTDKPEPNATQPDASDLMSCPFALLSDSFYTFDRISCSEDATAPPDPLETFDPRLCSGDTAGPPSQNLAICHSTSAQPAPSMSYELPLPLTALAALYINGEILGLKCNLPIAGRSAPVAPSIPLSLHPTPTQLRTVHPLSFDRFPFPKVRDNMIVMSFIIDDDEFVHDIFTMPSFSITPGAAAWDPKGWKIEKPFAQKWGFLFCS